MGTFSWEVGSQPGGQSWDGRGESQKGSELHQGSLHGQQHPALRTLIFGVVEGSPLTSGVSGPWWDSSESRLRCCLVVMPPGAHPAPSVPRRAAVPSVICEGCMLARRSVSVGSPVFISSSVMVPSKSEGCRGGGEERESGAARSWVRWDGVAGCPPRYPALQRVAGLEVRRAGAVALLQLGDAVPIVQLLRFILTRPQVDAAAT